MFDNSNPYTLRKEILAGFAHYYVSFEDSTGKRHEIEVKRIVYLEFMRFIKRERTLRRRDERHMEQSRLPPEVLCEQDARPEKSAEEAVFDNLRDETMRQILAELPKTQRRRLLLYHEYGLTYEQIAAIENCTFQAVAKSITAANTNIKKIFFEKG
jgi:RNA polymerase sigma-70 factor (ECF subfamily)